jgi:inositol-phosphate phosphatase/L-galactose 1-phosphate phosphatase
VVYNGMASLATSEFQAQHAAAREIALKAGAVIRNSRDRALAKVKSGVDLVTEVDQEVERLVTEHIRSRFPSDLIIGEEDQAENASGAQGDRIPSDGNAWCIDPIDGTTNFVHNYPFFCVSIGYCVKGVPRVGVIYIPSSDSLYEAVDGCGAYLSGTKLSVDSATGVGDALLVNNIGHHRENDFVDESAERVRRWLRAGLRGYRSSGSAAINMAHVASGIVSCYYEHGYGGPWDVCAGLVLVQEAGGVARNARDGAEFVLSFGRGSICAGNGKVVDDVIKVAGKPKVDFL